MSLKQWAKENSKFLKIDDGETVNVKYVGYVMALNQNQEETPCFKFQTEDGKTKILQSKNSSFIDAFDENDGRFKKGDYVQISRTGTKQNTRYEISEGEIKI